MLFLVFAVFDGAHWVEVLRAENRGLSFLVKSLECLVWIYKICSFASRTAFFGNFQTCLINSFLLCLACSNTHALHLLQTCFINLSLLCRARRNAETNHLVSILSSTLLGGVHHAVRSLHINIEDALIARLWGELLTQSAHFGLSAAQSLLISLLSLIFNHLYLAIIFSLTNWHNVWRPCRVLALEPEHSFWIYRAVPCEIIGVFWFSVGVII